MSKPFWLTAGRDEQNGRTVTVGPGPLLAALAVIFLAAKTVRSRRTPKE